MSSRLIRYFQVLCCMGTPDGSSSRPLGSRSGIHQCHGAPSIGEAERVDCPQYPVFRVVECPHSSQPSRRKAEDRLTPVPPVMIANCSPSHDAPSRGDNERIDCLQLPVFRTFPSPFSLRTPLRLTPSTNRQYNQSSPPPRREAEDQLTPVPLTTIADRPPYHDSPSPSERETEQVNHSQRPVFQTLPDPSSSRAPFSILRINRQYNPSLPPPQEKVDGPAGEAEMRINEIAEVRPAQLPGTGPHFQIRSPGSPYLRPLFPSASYTHTYKKMPSGPALKSNNTWTTFTTTGSVGHSSSHSRSHVTFCQSSSLHMHPLFAYSRLHHAPIQYDVGRTPSALTVLDITTHSPVPAHSLAQPATDPPTAAPSQLVLRSHKFPWKIVVKASSVSTSGKKLKRSNSRSSVTGTVITNSDVLYAIHTTLLARVTPEEWEALGNGSKAQRKVTRAYEKRCMIVGDWEGGVRRVDWLGGKTHLVGIEVDKSGVGQLVFARII